mmetsp:Transcript_892/g.3249  ORF Transcript_892/g.3249 Transcript_892/m.3249 type:complete len:316 (+) Transcript_892:2291-3238(+)
MWLMRVARLAVRATSTNIRGTPGTRGWKNAYTLRRRPRVPFARRRCSSSQESILCTASCCIRYWRTDAGLSQVSCLSSRNAKSNHVLSSSPKLSYKPFTRASFLTAVGSMSPRRLTRNFTPLPRSKNPLLKRRKRRIYCGCRASRSSACAGTSAAAVAEELSPPCALLICRHLSMASWTLCWRTPNSSARSRRNLWRATRVSCKYASPIRTAMEMASSSLVVLCRQALIKSLIVARMSSVSSRAHSRGVLLVSASCTAPKSWEELISFSRARVPLLSVGDSQESRRYSSASIGWPLRGLARRLRSWAWSRRFCCW